MTTADRPTPVNPPDSGRSAWWWAAVCFSGGMAVLGLAQPSLAVAAVLVVGLGLACGFVGFLGWRLFGHLRTQPRSELAPAIYQRPKQVLPHHVARIAPDPHERKPVLAAGARAGLVTVATERLWARHGLNLHDPAHHAHIERVLSPDLWQVVRPDRIGASGTLAPRPTLLHRDLDRLLDDLESI